MTKAELVEEVSRVSDLTKKHSEVIVDTVFKSIVDALHRGEKIELRGFGSFRLRQREPRKGRNPEDRRQGRRAAEEGAVLQARQGTEGSDQPDGDDGAPRSLEFDRSIPMPMDRLWTPWRLAYVTEASTATPPAASSATRSRALDDRAARRAPRPARRSSSSTSFPTTTAT